MARSANCDDITTSMAMAANLKRQVNDSEAALSSAKAAEERFHVPDPHPAADSLRLG